MSSGARNWPFLMLTTLPVRAAATIRSVWRDRNAGNLQDVGDLRRPGRLPGLVDVGQDRHADLAPHARERGQPGLEPGPRNDCPTCDSPCRTTP